MGNAGIESIAQELNTVFGSRNIDVVHDGDNKSDKLYGENGCAVTHHYDKNHALGSLKRRLSSAKKEATEKYHVKQPFYGIEGRIISFAGYLIDNVPNPEERKALWSNTPNHLIGDHTNCRHPSQKNRKGRPPKTPKPEKAPEEFYIWKKGQENEKLKEALQTYCDKTAEIVCNVAEEACTNPNESINSAQTKYANKRYAFGPSYSARIGIAVGNWNDKSNFTTQVLEATGTANYICPKIMSQIQNRCKTQEEQNQKRQEPYEQKRTNLCRKQIRQTYKCKKEGDYMEKHMKYE